MKSTYKQYSTILHTNQEESLTRVNLTLDETINDVLVLASEKYRISKSQLANEIIREHFLQEKEFSEEKLSNINIRRPGNRKSRTGQRKNNQASCNCTKSTVEKRNITAPCKVLQQDSSVRPIYITSCKKQE